MSEQPINVENNSTIDLALNPARLRFTFIIAIVWVIPAIIMLALFDEANFALIPFWSLTCISWIFGGNSRMSAVIIEEGREPTATDGLDLVKQRWLALLFGPLLFSIVVMLCSLLLFWLINLASGWEFLGALLTIPTFILVLISAAIGLNVYLMCTIIGYDNVGIMVAGKKLTTIAIKKPYYLFSLLADLISSTFFLTLFSGIIVASAIYSALAITGGIDLSNLISIAQSHTVNDSGFVSVIRSASVTIIVVTWLSFLVNVAAITSSMAYSGDA